MTGRVKESTSRRLAGDGRRLWQSAGLMQTIRPPARLLVSPFESSETWNEKRLSICWNAKRTRIIKTISELIYVNGGEELEIAIQNK